MFYSPLRYPGGKGKLEPFMELMIKKMNHVGGVYIEPFAGGANIALHLLFSNLVGRIIINDLEPVHTNASTIMANKMKPAKTMSSLS